MKVMTKHMVWIGCLGWLLAACVSNHITWNANANIKKIALGMSREQVIQILGNDYLVTSSAKDERGNPVEILAYKSAVYEEYRLKFVDAQLAEWSREFTNKYPVKEPTP